MGSMQKRGDTTWLLTVSSGFGINGKRTRHTKTVQAKDENQAKKLLNRFEVEVESNSFANAGKISFEKFAVEWLDKYAKNNIADRTYQTYDEMIRLRISPAFGALRLEQIKPMHILDFYSNLQEDGIRKDGKKGGLSAQTIKHYHRLLSIMFNTAVEWQLMKDNPAARIKSPKVPKTEVDSYSVAQIEKLIEKLNSAPVKYMTIVMLGIFTGISRSEIMGLTWDNINFDENDIDVKKAAQYVRRAGVSMKDPKNKYRARKISVPKFMMDLLAAHKTIQSEDKLKLDGIYQKYDDHPGFVFAQDKGKPMHPDTITSWFHDFIVDNQLSHITFHGLRHSHATILINEKEDIVTVSRRLGHNKTSTTVDIYAHLLKTSEKSAACTFENLLLKSVDNSKVSTNCQQDGKKVSS
jgi:integrase